MQYANLCLSSKKLNKWQDFTCLLFPSILEYLPLTQTGRGLLERGIYLKLKSVRPLFDKRCLLDHLITVLPYKL